MTTQNQYDPVSRQPDAPPWASPQPPPGPQPPAEPGPPWGGGDHSRHGQVMVAYPDLLDRAARRRPPSWVPVVPITLLTGPFGAISAARRAGRARRGGNARYPYWLAFAVTFGLCALLSTVMLAAAVPVYLRVREAAATTAVESGLVHDGRVRTAAGTRVTAATCTPIGRRDAGGLRAYSCGLTLSGLARTVRVVADRTGNWSITRTK